MIKCRIWLNDADIEGFINRDRAGKILLALNLDSREQYRTAAMMWCAGYKSFPTEAEMVVYRLSQPEYVTVELIGERNED